MLRGNQNPGIYCACGKKAEMYMNLGLGVDYGRHYWGCGGGATQRLCGLFHWIDPPHNDRAKEVISNLLAAIQNLEEEIGKTKESEMKMKEMNLMIWAIVVVLWIRLKMKDMNLMNWAIVVVLWIRLLCSVEEADDLAGLCGDAQVNLQLQENRVMEVESELNVMKGRVEKLWIALFVMMGIVVSVLMV